MRSMNGAVLLGLLVASASGHAAFNDARITEVNWTPFCSQDQARPPKLEERTAVDVATQKSAVVASIVAVVAPKVIGAAVDAAANGLKAAGESKSFVSTAKVGDRFYSLKESGDLFPRNQCLVVHRYEPALMDGAGKVVTPQRVIFYLEAKMVLLTGTKHFLLEPVFVQVSDYDQASAFAWKSRDFSLAVTFTIPGSDSPFGSAELRLSNVERGVPWSQTADSARLVAASSLPIALPPESPDASAAKSKREAALAPYLLAIEILEGPPAAKTPREAPEVEHEDVSKEALKKFCTALAAANERVPKEHYKVDERCKPPALVIATEVLSKALLAAKWSPERRVWANETCGILYRDAKEKLESTCENTPPLGLDKEKNKFTYFTTQLTLTEVRDGSKFAKFLGEALGASKDGLSAELAKQVLPKTKEQVEAEAQTARDVRTALVLSDLEVTKADQALSSLIGAADAKPADITAARIALVKAKIEANKAYRKGGLTPPFPDLE